MKRLPESDLETIRSEGFILKKEFFSPDEVKKLRETTLRLRPVSMPHVKPSRKWILPSPSFGFRQCLKPRVREDLVYLSEVARGSGFRSFSEQYYGQPVVLDHIMSIESPISNEAITAWHTDANSKADNQKPADRFTLKFFIYLNDVDEPNGAFSYVPRTHRLVTVLREAYNKGELPHHWTGRFPDLKEILADEKNAAYVRAKLGQGAIDSFYEAARRTKYGDEGYDEYYLRGPAGTVCIFDDRGLHRGGIPRAGERSVLRYNYIATKYWAAQFTPLRYAVNVFLKSFLPEPVAAHW